MRLATRNLISFSDLPAMRAALIAAISFFGHAAHRSPSLTGGVKSPCLIPPTVTNVSRLRRCINVLQLPHISTNNK
jgi:hypothetical protein